MSEEDSKPETVGGERVAATTNYLAPDGPGFSTIVEIWAKGAKLSKPTVALSPGDKVNLSFRFFETSNPVKIAATVDEEGFTDDQLSVTFQNMDGTLRRMFAMILRKLKARARGDICKGALLKDHG